METSIKDNIIQIMTKLDDQSLGRLCSTQKRLNQICQDENFWRNRFENRFGKIAGGYKPKDRTWRDHYIHVVTDLQTYSKNPWSFLNEVNWNIRDDDFEELGEGTERYHNNFWMLNLGKEITLIFPIDPYDQLLEHEREYKLGETYFTPAKVLKLIYDFYQEPITKDELEEQQMIDNPFASDYTEDDIGKVLRADMLGKQVYLADGGFATTELGENIYRVNLFIND